MQNKSFQSLGTQNGRHVNEAPIIDWTSINCAAGAHAASVLVHSFYRTPKKGHCEMIKKSWFS